MKYVGEIKLKQGKLQLHIVNRAIFDYDISQFKEGQKVEIEVKKLASRRTNNQNAYYWGVIVPSFKALFSQIGHKLTNEEVHEAIRERFLKEDEIVDNDGEYLFRRVKSTAKLSKSQFIDYIDSCIEWAATYFNYEIPLPNEENNYKL